MLFRSLTLMHGEVLPVVELAPLFGRAPSDIAGPLLVVGVGRAELGVRTEEVEEVTVLASSELLAPPTSLDDAAGHLVSAADRDGTLVLEGEALLGDSRLMFDLSGEGAA